MNFKFKNTSAEKKIVIVVEFSLVMILASFLSFGCSPKSKLNDVQGDVRVKIPVSAQSGQSSDYELAVVTLKGISNLKNVSGFFAQFFFSPGLNQNQLVGDSPQARFIKTSENIYIPVDALSQQMATLYYHIQNLFEFSQLIGAGDVNQQTMKMGLETNVKNSEVLSKNNAFYDGKSDAMLFVPFSSEELPIAVNSGIIAHEYFHSLFYKLILKNLESQKTELSVQKMQPLYNETYLRGINEGLADFWGWAYTNDDDFMRWSLSFYSKNRKLVLSDLAIGQFENSENIFLKVQTALLSGSAPSEYLSDYIYKIGTPNARFLKQLTAMMTAAGGLSPVEAKVKIAKSVILFLKNLSIKAKQISSTEILPAESLFEFIASTDSNIKLSQSQCEFVLSYIQKNELRATDVCKKQSDDSYQIKSFVKDIVK